MHHQDGAGVATPDPGEAPPMAGLSYNQWLFVDMSSNFL